MVRRTDCLPGLLPCRVRRTWAMFVSLGRWAARHPWLICTLWLLFALAAGLAAPDWDSRAHDDDIRSLPERCASVRGYQLLERAFPQDVFASRAIFVLERPDRKLDDDDLRLAEEVALEVTRLAGAEPALQIKKVYSH